MPDTLYRILVDYVDPAIRTYRGPAEGFTEAANRAEDFRIEARTNDPDRHVIRGIYLERLPHHVIVWNASLV
jgi:hypothetical protein